MCQVLRVSICHARNSMHRPNAFCKQQREPCVQMFGKFETKPSYNLCLPRPFAGRGRSEFQHLCRHLCGTFSSARADIVDTLLEVAGMRDRSQVFLAESPGISLRLGVTHLAENQILGMHIKVLKILLGVRATTKLRPSFLDLKFLVLSRSQLQH